MAIRPKSYKAYPDVKPAANLKRPDKFYESADWRKVRRVVLAKNPMCAREGCTSLASHVDHIVPRKQGGADYALSNLQGLCHSCHSTKTGIERRRRRGY